MAFDLTKYVTVPEVPIVVTFDDRGRNVVIGAVVVIGLAAIITAAIATRDHG